TRPIVVLMLAGGVWSGMTNIALFSGVLASGRPVEQAMAMTFASLVLIQFFKAYNYRSDRLSVFHRPFANHWLNLAVAWELTLLAALIYVPWLHGPFTTFSFTTTDLLLVAAPATSVVPVIELAKVMGCRGWFGEIT
ncbi:MAG TPA: cation-translocating P-type ATPase C-terminal domain-containing protein, partial [Vicinamibacterales bacterium]|nr:cation-translocating P-type ATPase C-terminal domain-containing protein [Vicinamibacterales bacterium]